MGGGGHTSESQGLYCCKAAPRFLPQSWGCGGLAAKPGGVQALTLSQRAGIWFWSFPKIELGGALGRAPTAAEPLGAEVVTA